mgnify:FL=1
MKIFSNFGKLKITSYFFLIILKKMFLIFMLMLIVILTFSLPFSSYEKEEKEEKSGGADKPGTGTRDYKLWRKVEENIYFEPLYNRELLPTMQTEKFYRVNYREVLILKLGQRKLLFNELEFYNICGQRTTKNITVVYAGSAPGIHSTLIAKLFPHWQFHYYDANPFCEELFKYKNIFLYNQFFSDEEALKWNKFHSPSNYLIFVSDIRTVEDDDSVEKDMAMQRKWTEIIKPDACMLKFRLRWRPAGTMEYFDGKIYFQPRISFSSTETRLIFFSAKR